MLRWTETTSHQQSKSLKVLPRAAPQSALNFDEVNFIDRREAKRLSVFLTKNGTEWEIRSGLN